MDYVGEERDEKQHCQLQRVGPISSVVLPRIEAVSGRQACNHSAQSCRVIFANQLNCCSLAHARLHYTIAAVVARFGRHMKLRNTTKDNVDFASDYFVPYPKEKRKVQVLVGLVRWVAPSHMRV
jgi:hypothetical protein